MCGQRTGMPTQTNIEKYSGYFIHTSWLILFYFINKVSDILGTILINYDGVLYLQFEFFTAKINLINFLKKKIATVLFFSRRIWELLNWMS